MARKEPKPSIVKQLFAFSGNQCAFEGCTNLLIDDNTVIGEICHIEAAEQGGKRYNIDSDDETRRDFPNLILMCPICHKKIDLDENKYTVEILRNWKNQHEENSKHKNYQVSDKVVEQIIQKFMKQDNKNTGNGVQINQQAETINIETQIGTQNVQYVTESSDKKLNIDGVRQIVETFKSIIDKHISKASPPAKSVIDYQNELIERIPRDVHLIETKFLKFRTENGRIKSDVLSHERIHNVKLDDKEDSTQKLLRGFLANSDIEKKISLKQQLLHKGQQQPAIITCDGFLVNGNRRKMALEELFVEHDQNSKFEKMRIVVLPENVTEKDIRKIENRYQLQDEGKSEYQGINRALTMRDNISIGYDLRAQLKDDPKYADKDKREFDKIVKNYEKEYLQPLECAENYITHFDKSDIYKSVSESTGDREGRWEAFKDYSKFYFGTLKNDQQRVKSNILESEVGKIEDIAFKIIRKRDLRGLSKLHMFMRPPNLKKFLGNEEAKKILFEIVDKVDEDIPNEYKFDKEGNKISESEIDKTWGGKYEEQIIGSLMRAKRVVESQTERDKPLDLLEDALKKLQHENLQIENMGIEHYKKALKLTKNISQKADKIYGEIDHARGNLNKLKKKGK